MNAHDILQAGMKHMDDRAATYDKPDGERSIPATVAAFNALTGHSLTDEQGWLFMALVKAARSQSGGEFKGDTYEDGSAYFALMGEAAYQRWRLGLPQSHAIADAPVGPWEGIPWPEGMRYRSIDNDCVRSFHKKMPTPMTGVYCARWESAGREDAGKYLKVLILSAFTVVMAALLVHALIRSCDDDNEPLRLAVTEFYGRYSGECAHAHKLQGTGAVFFQSVGLLRCAECGGWQFIRKPVV